MTGIFEKQRRTIERRIKEGINPDYKRPRFKKPSNFKNEVWKKTNGFCAYCGVQLLPFGREKNSFAIDHIVPLAKNGTNDIENLIPSCISCNSKKGVK